MQTPDPTPTPLAPVLAEMRKSLCAGDITDKVTFRPGMALHADPALKVGGQYRLPAGRLLELEVTTAAKGDWIALHVSLTATNLADHAYIGLACRSAAPREQLIQPCLRSGTDDGFHDCFFDKHILAGPEPRNHVDALHIETHRDLPTTAPWRELVLFLPKHSFRWDLHDLRMFLV